MSAESTAETTGETVMPFLQHLEELRRMLLSILVAVIVGALLCWVFSDRVLDWLIDRTTGTAIFMKPQGAFLARLKVALVLGLLLTLPFVCLLYTSPSPRDQRGSRMPSSA